MMLQGRCPELYRAFEQVLLRPEWQSSDPGEVAALRRTLHDLCAAMAAQIEYPVASPGEAPTIEELEAWLAHQR